MERLVILLLLVGCLSLFAGDKVDINQADKATLETVKGIGPVLAQKILDYRTANGAFATINDLQKVKGIGPATLEKMKPMLTVTTAPAYARLDLNAATAGQLEELPGIGDVLAQRIIDYRNANGRFNSIAELEKVNGISKSTIVKFRTAVKISGTAVPRDGTTSNPPVQAKTGKLKIYRQPR